MAGFALAYCSTALYVGLDIACTGKVLLLHRDRLEQLQALLQTFQGPAAARVRHGGWRAKEVLTGMLLQGGCNKSQEEETALQIPDPVFAHV